MHVSWLLLLLYPYILERRMALRILSLLWDELVSECLAGLQRAAKASNGQCSQLASSAALMAAAAFLWRQVHPTSHQLLQAIVVAIELSSGYAETKRKAATGRIRTG